ncbi:MAG: L,D-transpeptidase family protein [Roseimicrobium sp.]
MGLAPSGNNRAVEPGLERAVLWKWRVLPSAEPEWGFPALVPKGPEGVPTGVPTIQAETLPRPTTYEVMRGDALIKIGKKFGMTATQLKQFNGLATDAIRVGQTLKIPTVEELRALVPPPVAKVETPTARAPVEPTLSFEAKRLRDQVLLQVFLDRENFSVGLIDGTPGATVEKVAQLYHAAHPDAQTAEGVRAKALASVGEPYTSYTLREEDFRFIDRNWGGASAGGKASKAKSATSKDPVVTFAQLAVAPVLVYRSPWEFVAERYHCDEALLRNLNVRLKGQLEPGTVFQVPNVFPFEVEKLLQEPLQPAADPQAPVEAAIVDLARLEITRSGKLIAVMPLGFARPDLRGRGSWTILDAIARPKLATLQELREPPKPSALATEAPAAPAVLAEEQGLAPGPNNPVGVVWINLAKAKSTEPLSYGLHGTSIPSRMKTQEGIGGIRLTNWDIARAVRLLPPGTRLVWK